MPSLRPLSKRSNGSFIGSKILDLPLKSLWQWVTAQAPKPNIMPVKEDYYGSKVLEPKVLVQVSLVYSLNITTQTVILS